MASVKEIVGVFVSLLVGVAFVSPLAVSTYDASQDGNLSSTAQTIITLVATMFCVGLMMVAVSLV